MTAWHQDDGSGAIPSPSTKELRRKPRRNCRKQVKDLRKGDGLSVTHVGGVASKIVAQQTRLVGTVKSADPDAKRLGIRATGPKGEEGTNNDVTVRVDDQTVIETTDGKAIKLGDLKELHFPRTAPGHATSLNTPAST